MARSQTTKKQRRIDEADRQNLVRFGCTFNAKTRVLYIDWRGTDVSQAGRAEIFARLVCLKTQKGPVVLIAVEISAVRPLPQFFYFPFDLGKQAHKNYLSRFIQTGEIKLCFLANKRTFDRTHQLTQHLRSRALEVHAEALREWEVCKTTGYDFDGALQILERHVRIPLLLDRVLLEDTRREITSRIKETLQTVPNENRELASRTVREAADAFTPVYQKHKESLLAKLFLVRLASVCIVDVHRLFADNPAGCIEFLSELLACIMSQKELENLGQLMNLSDSITTLFRKRVIEQGPAVTGPPSPIPELPAGLVDLIGSMVSSGIPKDATNRICKLIGLEIGGKPGRPPKNYSRAYELKMSGASWTETARRELAGSPELQEECCTSNYDSLDSDNRYRLRNRVRQGVINYAERTGKPLPSESEVP